MICKQVSIFREEEGTIVELKWDFAWAHSHISNLKAGSIPTCKNNHSSIILSEVQAS